MRGQRQVDRICIVGAAIALLAAIVGGPTARAASAARAMAALPGATLLPTGSERAKPASPLRVTRARLRSGERSSDTLHAATSLVGAPLPPFTECPPVGWNSSCALLIVVTNDTATVYSNPSQGTFDGADDTLIGIRNESDSALDSIHLSSGAGLFTFDGDGLCSYFLPGCPFGSTGYEGPGTSFSHVAADGHSGDVDFGPSLAPGASTYFSLEESLDSTAVVTGSPSADEQGGAPNPSENATTCSTARPVNCATGAFWHRFTDVQVPGLGVPLAFTRTYSSPQAGVDGPLGHGWSFSYGMHLVLDGAGNATVVQEDGSSVVFHDMGGGWSAAPWVLASLIDNGDGSYTFSRYATRVKYVFDGAGRLISEQDRNGRETQLSYDGAGDLTTVTDEVGRSLTLTYNGSRISSVTDPMGHVTSFIYDAAGDLAGSTDPLGREWSFDYDQDHLLLSMTDPRGGTTSNVYDGAQRVVQQVDPAARTTIWGYSGDPSSPAGGTTTVIDPRGVATQYDYANFQLGSVTRAVGTSVAATTSYAYDPQTLGVSQITDPNGHVMTRTYDAHGNVTGTTDALWQWHGYSYDADGNLLSATDPSGVTTSYAYDADGNLIATSRPLYETGEVATSTYTYGSGATAGELLTATDPDGAVTRYGYDASGDRTSVTDPSGRTTTAAYDANGHRTSTTSPAGNAPGGDPAAHTTSFSYDADGELTATTDPLGHVWRRSYDASGNEIAETDPDGRTTTYVYDADNERVQTRRADGTTTATAYDDDGNVTAQTDGNGHSTTYAVDELGRTTRMTDPNGRTTDYAYDPVGNLLAVTDAAGRQTTYAYDSADRLISTDYSDDATTDVQQVYDVSGRRVWMSDGTGSSSFAYDSLGRLVDQYDGAGRHVGYGYDLRGNLTTIVYPSGESVSRSFDAAGRLTGIRDWLGHSAAFSYDADGNLVGQQLPGSVSVSASYDDADRLTGIADANAGGPIASLVYRRAPSGQVTDETASGATEDDHAYAYDEVGRLAADGAAAFAYDAADDPTTLAGSPQTFDPSGAVLTSGAHAAPAPDPQPEPRPQPQPEPRPGPQPPGVVPPAPPAPTPPQAGTTDHGRVVHVDAAVAGRKRRGRGAIRTAPLTTTRPGELLLALVSAHGPARGRQGVRAIHGGGLHWSSVEQSASAGGAVSAWWTRAPSRLAHVRFAVSERIGGYPGAAEVVAFSPGAKIDHHAHASGSRGAPSLRLSASADATVWTVGHDAARAAHRAPLPGNVLVLQQSMAGSGTAWVQRSVVRQSGAVAVGAARPPSSSWSLAAVEVTADPTAAGSARHAVDRVRARRPHQASAVDLGALLPVDDTSKRTFLYDAVGDRTEVSDEHGGAVSLAWDQAGRLVGVGEDVSYSYDGDGLRASKTSGGAPAGFTWDRSGSVPLLLQADGTAYVYGPDGQAFEQISGGAATSLLRDRQGSARVLTNAQGEVVGTYRYDAWGRARHSGAASTDLQYDGQYADAETGYQYLRSRYYDPSTGQFLSTDPAAVQTRRRYVYADDAPTNLSDPLGLFAVGLCASASGTVVDGGGASGSVVTCTWKGFHPSFTATTVTGSVSAGIGLDDGVSGQGHVVYSAATNPEGLAGSDCSVGASGHLLVGLGLSAGGCTGAFGLDFSADFGLEGGASATGGWGHTCVTSSSTGYVGCGGDGDGPVSSHRLCYDPAYDPYRDIA